MNGERGEQRISVADIVERFKTQTAKNPSFCFAQTPHFLVAYESAERQFIQTPTWIDSDPLGLAQYLEAELLLAANHFQLCVPSTIQIVSIRQPRWWLPSELKGLHLQSHTSLMGFLHAEKLKNASWNVIFLSRGSPKEVVPFFYECAVHESIGHGFILDSLLRRWKEKTENNIPFLSEGIAQYIERLHFPAQEHDGLILHVLFRALRAFPQLGKKFTFEGLSTHFLSTEMSHYHHFGIKTDLVFNLRQARVGKRWFQKVLGGEDHYWRGQSFVTTFIYRFGVEAFCHWASYVEAETFEESLMEVTGLSIDEIEWLWRNDILESFDVSRVSNWLVEKARLEDRRESIVNALTQIKIFLENLDLNGQSRVL